MHVVESRHDFDPLCHLLETGDTLPLFSEYPSIGKKKANIFTIDKFESYYNKTESLTHIAYDKEKPFAALVSYKNDWLSNHFGIVIAETSCITLEGVNPAKLIELFQCHLKELKQFFSLSIMSLPFNKITLNAVASQSGYQLMTVRSKYLAKKDSLQPVRLRHRVVPYHQSYKAAVSNLLSKVTFPSHFTADEKLDQSKVSDMYKIWMLKEDETAVKPIVLRSSGVVGAASMTLRFPHQSALPAVFGSGLIASSRLNSGVAYSLIGHGINETLKRADYIEFIVSSEVISLVKILNKLGFSRVNTNSVYHCWL